MATEASPLPGLHPMRNDPGRHWAAVVPFVPAGVLSEQARALEAAGLAGIQAPQIYGPPFVPLAVGGGATSAVRLATGIALAFARSPFETAVAAMDLDRISSGRFTLGLGTSVKSWSEGFFGMEYGKPVEHMREVVEIVRLVIAKSHTGELDALRRQVPPPRLQRVQPARRARCATHIPIWIAGAAQRR